MYCIFSGMGKTVWNLEVMDMPIEEQVKKA